jgi:hypothetical protein
MTHKPGKAAISKHVTELRREAVAALKRFNMIAERLNLYAQYLALSKTYHVQMAGPFLVIKGATERPNRHGVRIIQSPPLRGSSDEENSYC